MLESKRGHVLAIAVDDGILKERERRQAREAIVGQDVKKVAIDVLRRRPHRPRATTTRRPCTGRRSNSVRARDISCMTGSRTQLTIPVRPLVRARHVERRVEREIARQVVALFQRVQHVVIRVARRRLVVALAQQDEQVGRQLRQRLSSARRSGEAPAPGRMLHPGQREDAPHDRRIDQMREPRQPFDRRSAGEVSRVRARAR